MCPTFPYWTRYPPLGREGRETYLHEVASHQSLADVGVVVTRIEFCADKLDAQSGCHACLHGYRCVSNCLHPDQVSACIPHKAHLSTLDQDKAAEQHSHLDEWTVPTTRAVMIAQGCLHCPRLHTFHSSGPLHSQYLLFNLEAEHALCYQLHCINNSPAPP